jgi:hypothetical protein
MRELAVSDGENTKAEWRNVRQVFQEQRRKLEKAEKQKQLDKEKKDSDIDVTCWLPHLLYTPVI